MNQEPRRSRRLELRLTPEERMAVEEASLLRTGGDMSRFVTAAAVDAARSAIAEQFEAVLTAETRQQFYEALFDTSPRPGLDALFSRPYPDDL